MQLTLALTAALIGGGVMMGRPQDSYALADAPIPAPAVVTPARIEIPAGTPIPVQLDEEVSARQEPDR